MLAYTQPRIVLLQIFKRGSVVFFPVLVHCSFFFLFRGLICFHFYNRTHAQITRTRQQTNIRINIQFIWFDSPVIKKMTGFFQ